MLQFFQRLLVIAGQLFFQLAFQQIAKRLHLVPLQRILHIVGDEDQDRIKVQAADMARQFQPAVCAHVDIQERNIELPQGFVRQCSGVAADRYSNVATVFRLISAHQIGYFLAKGCVVIANQRLDPCRHGCFPFRME